MSSFGQPRLVHDGSGKLICAYRIPGPGNRTYTVRISKYNSDDCIHRGSVTLRWGERATSVSGELRLPSKDLRDAWFEPDGKNAHLMYEVTYKGALISGKNPHQLHREILQDLLGLRPPFQQVDIERLQQRAREALSQV